MIMPDQTGFDNANLEIKAIEIGYSFFRAVASGYGVGTWFSGTKSYRVYYPI